MSRTPAIRFKGFTDPWEQRKLNRFIFVTNDKNVDGMFAREDVLSVSREEGVVNQIEFQGRSFAGADVSVYGILRHGDIVYTKSPLRANPYGIIKTNKGCSGIVSTLYATYRARSGVDPNFVQCYFDQDARLNNYLHPLVNKGAKNDMKVSAENAITGEVTFPGYDEQRRIASLLASLDNLITLHQRKYDKLVTLKKALLDKMFPRDGACVPELRFAGFTDPWEQRKLGELGTTYGGLTGKTKDDFGHGDARFVPYTNVFDNPVADPSRLGLVEIDPGQNQVRYGDALFTVSSETPEEVGMSSVWLSDLDNLYLNSFCFGYRQDGSFDPYYLAYMLRSKSVRGDIELLAQGISRFNISKGKVMEVVVPVPAMSEQRQIGALFTSLDNLITLHQRKLELLKNLKAALLDKMFV